MTENKTIIIIIATAVITLVGHQFLTVNLANTREMGIKDGIIQQQLHCEERVDKQSKIAYQEGMQIGREIELATCKQKEALAFNKGIEQTTKQFEQKIAQLKKEAAIKLKDSLNAKDKIFKDTLLMVKQNFEAKLKLKMASFQRNTLGTLKKVSQTSVNIKPSERRIKKGIHRNNILMDQIFITLITLATLYILWKIGILIKKRFL